MTDVKKFSTVLKDEVGNDKTVGCAKQFVCKVDYLDLYGRGSMNLNSTVEFPQIICYCNNLK